MSANMRGHLGDFGLRILNVRKQSEMQGCRTARIGIGVLLLAACACAQEWTLGAPAPSVEGTGRIVVTLTSEDISPGIKAGVERLGAQGVQVFRRPAKEARAYLVDETGVVRRRGEIPSTAEELVDFVTEWVAGRAIFRNRCARCHGEDGMDTGYPFIRQLGGIGSRWTQDQIRAMLNPAGSHPVLVRGDQYSTEDFEALIIFLAGL